MDFSFSDCDLNCVSGYLGLPDTKLGDSGSRLLNRSGQIASRVTIMPGSRRLPEGK